MDQGSSKASTAHDSDRIINKHIASPPPAVRPIAITETMSPNKKTLNFHAGPEVQQFGHVRVSDGQPISDVVGGRIHVHGAASDISMGTQVGEHGHHHHHHFHHTPDGSALSDPPKEYLHDGTSYASGASNKPYDDHEPERPGLATRIKEALPGTREHKEKKEREGDLAVYM